MADGLPLADLLSATLDGDWGLDAPHDGYVAFRVIRGTDLASVRSGDTLSVPVRYLREDSVQRRRLRALDIVIETAGGGRDRPTGRTLLLRQHLLNAFDLPVTCASFSRFLRVDPAKADPEYVFWYLQSLYKDGVMWEYQVQHTGVARFQYTLFAGSTLVPLPPRSTQLAIAFILGSLEDKITLNRQVNRTVGAMAQAIFKSWFVDFDPVVARAAGRQPFGMDRDTAKLFPDAFVDSPVGPLPSGWRLGPLADVVEINALQISGASAPATIHYVDISSVSGGRVDAVTTYSWASAPSRAQRLVRHGDTIWSCVRPNRRSYCLVQHPEPDLVVSTGFAVLSPSDGASAFVYLWTTTDDFVEYLTSHAEGSAYPAVRPESFARASVSIPPLPVLRAFQERVGPLLNLVARRDEEARTLIALRDTLIPKLLSGEIRVQEAENAAGRLGA